MKRIVTDEEAAAAVKTLLQFAGDDPEREGLQDTPDRVVRAYKEWFCGYKQDPRQILERTFSEVNGYDEIVILKDIRMESHCEHHMTPIIGSVTIGYIPTTRVVGISKLARLVDAFSKRFQIQEVLTSQIAHTINDVLAPQGVAVVIRAHHLCITTRGVHKPAASMITSSMLGVFRDDPKARAEFLKLVDS
tara:strand:+ start:3811 stop:4383 length:573 start_codon:yes stop_codon:yes gene_type:complete